MVIMQDRKMISQDSSRESLEGLEKMYEEDSAIDLSQELDDNIKDLCKLRKSIPSKCCEVLDQIMEIKTPKMENLSSISSYEAIQPSVENEWKQFQSDFDKMMQKCKGSYEKNSLPEDFKLLVKHCETLMMLEDVQRGMGLDDTQELLFSGKKKQNDCETPLEKKRSLRRSGLKDLPSLASSAGKRTSERKAGSLSKIPKLKQGTSTPRTPVSASTSLRKKLFRKAAKRP
ncbi:uncharacterized protein LOC135694555 isoform X2 [Rhopilema esculentum]|uniref:uncharacterized protein LOC135694555 isoform X2 n=1 Tax=Rhopilema esculentum TaxID=499914 RepID=UPI0031DAE9B9